ncbi:hypothetical protein KIL84_001860 [Mauremys mutica]|uniref:Uncharacterized protein n=1 Tax=Mauremys mutica TaxID=74926 RepID=A0A9D3XJH2_9SAUR|nr:hypothetical protein KIL84_001860 [Mauremys mutica]
MLAGTMQLGDQLGGGGRSRSCACREEPPPTHTPVPPPAAGALRSAGAGVRPWGAAGRGHSDGPRQEGGTTPGQGRKRRRKGLGEPAAPPSPHAGAPPSVRPDGPRSLCVLGPAACSRRGQRGAYCLCDPWKIHAGENQAGGGSGGVLEGAESVSPETGTEVVCVGGETDRLTGRTGMDGQNGAYGDGQPEGYV